MDIRELIGEKIEELINTVEYEIKEERQQYGMYDLIESAKEECINEIMIYIQNRDKDREE